MRTKHLKSVQLVTDESKMWEHFEFPDGESWIVAFEVSEEFWFEFSKVMRERLHPMEIYESGLEPEHTLAPLYTTFIYEGASWFLGDTGSLIRSCEYEDIYDKQVPEDWWMSCIAIMKEVLARL